MLAVRDEQRRRHHDATHHVHAYRLRDGTSGRDDDGEPSGTAGAPALNALVEAGLHDAGVVVTRWFGGTELGTGGLARAYRGAVRRCLRDLEVVDAVPGRAFRLRFAYDDTGAVMRVLEAARARRLDARYGDRTRLDVALPAGRAEAVLRRLRDATGGRAEWCELEASPLIPVRR